MENIEKCYVCYKIFSTLSNLRKHLKKMHPTKKAELNKLYNKNRKQFQFKCECGKNFNHKHHFKAHQKIHSNQICEESPKKKCPLCNYRKLNKFKMLKHFKDTHCINTVSKQLEFPTLEKFMIWKTEMETETYSRYTENSKSTIPNIKSSSLSKPYEVIYYCCHRSGTYIPKGRGIRLLKSKGSNKINAYCPASIQLEKFKDGNCKVAFIETHVGHEMELERLQITPSEKKDLAIKIATGMSYDEIINEVKQSADPVETKRIHLLTKKDLHNIEICFNRPSALTKRNNTENKKNKGTLQEKKEIIMAEFSNRLHRINSNEELDNLRSMINSSVK